MPGMTGVAMHPQVWAGTSRRRVRRVTTASHSPTLLQVSNPSDSTQDTSAPEPSFPERLGIRIDAPDAGKGTVTAHLTVGDDMLNEHGTVHGGVLATLLDASMGATVRAMVDDDQTAATVSMTVTYFDAAAPGDELLVRTQARKAGNTLTLIEADATRPSDDTAIAHAVATFRVLDQH